MAIRSNRVTRRTVSKTHKTYNWRFLGVMTGLALLVSSLGARIVYLQVIDTEFLNNQADARSLRTESIPANRGIIKDRNGKALAVSTPVVSLWMNPGEIIAEREKWSDLAKALNMPLSDLEESISDNHDKHFSYLKRHIAPDDAANVLALEVRGVYSESEYRRFYPAAEVTSHVVGLTNIDEYGIEGVELAFDEHLRGLSGKKKVIKNRRGEVIKDIEIAEYAKAGEDLVLSIDLRAQYLAYKELSFAVDKYAAKSGSAVAVDVETGEILALVNQPSYNPNSRRNIDSQGVRNRAVTDLFEPGSTMKPFTVLAALESGKYSKNSYLDTRPGFMKIGSNTIRDHRNYGVIDMTTVLTKSSNVATAKLALSLEHGALHDVLERVGFGQSVASHMPGENDGYLPFLYENRPIEVAAMSYGYGLSVTATQLARSYLILANEGVEKPLSILRQNQKVKGKRVLDKKTSKDIVSMLETVVSAKGTASRASVHGYSVAGKTGTVHKVVNGVYADDQYTSLFVGMAPASNPKVVLVVVINNPVGDEYYGGLVAAPTFSKIMEGILRVTNVPPDRLDDFKHYQQVASLD